MPFSIFRLRTLVGANIAGLVLGTAMFGDVPDAHAVHAAGARLLGDEDRRRLPGSGRHGDLLTSGSLPSS